MHILMLSLAVAFLVCVVLLAVFWAFTLSPIGRRVEHHEPKPS